MKVILASDVESLGFKGDVVTVADGFARNFLVPKGLALIATKGTLRQSELMQRARAERDQKAKEAAAAKVSQLAASPVYISARAGEGGRLFGSVTAQEIVDAIRQARGLRLDRRKVQLEEPIKTTGSHMVTVEVHDGVTATVKTIVTAG